MITIDLNKEREKRNGVELSWETMSDSIREDEGLLRADAMSLDAIIEKLDDANVRNIALIAYVHALRDLQVAHNGNSYFDTDDRIERTQSRAQEAFAKLIEAERSLNDSPDRALNGVTLRHD
jgi:hypothetical protein